MTWAKLDNHFWAHPQVLAAGNEAIGLYVRLLSWASGHGKTVKVPVAQALEIAERPSSLWALVDHDLVVIDAEGVELLGRGELWRGFGGTVGRVKLQRWLRRQVIARDGLVCRLCGRPVDPHDVHIDHIVPWSLGGQNELENLQVAHSTCNIRKGARVQ